MVEWRKHYDGVENMSLAVMGCVVNGPGESKHANIGISLPGSGEHPVAPVFVDGKKTVTLKGDNIAAEFRQIVDQYVSEKYPKESGLMAKIVKAIRGMNDILPDVSESAGHFLSKPYNEWLASNMATVISVCRWLNKQICLHVQLVKSRILLRRRCIHSSINSMVKA